MKNKARLTAPPSWPLAAQALRWPVHWPTPEMRCFFHVGMVTCQKALQYCCFPTCVQIAFAYTNGSYSKGVQVDSKPAGCCAAPHWRISRKDYTVPADEKDLGKVGMAAVASMRKNGKVIFASPTRARAAAHSLPLVLPLICHAPFPHVVCLCAVSPVRRADRQALPEEGGGGQDGQDQSEVLPTGDVGRRAC